MAGYEFTRYNDLVDRHLARYLFLRINPDAFVNRLGKRVDPPFEARVRIAAVRLVELIDRAERGAFAEADPLVVAHHLFYDAAPRPRPQHDDAPAPKRAHVA